VTSPQPFNADTPARRANWHLGELVLLTAVPCIISCLSQWKGHNLRGGSGGPAGPAARPRRAARGGLCAGARNPRMSSSPVCGEQQLTEGGTCREDAIQLRRSVQHRLGSAQGLQPHAFRELDRSRRSIVLDRPLARASPAPLASRRIVGAGVPCNCRPRRPYLIKTLRGTWRTHLVQGCRGRSCTHDKPGRAGGRREASSLLRWSR